MTKAIIPGKLLLRNAYRLLSRQSSWDSPLVLDSPTKDDLTWWYHALESWNGRPIKTKPVEAQLVTDASQTGWGGVLNGKQAADYWDKQIARMPSNYRELLAILLAIKAFEHDLKGKTVQVLSVAAVAYINHLGGPSPSLTALASAVWITAYELEIALSAKHLAGKENVHADHLSRLSTHYEWQLHPRLFKFLDRTWGPHTIDRFASCTNTDLPLYNSLYFDPGSGGVDALAQLDWADHNNFVNALFRLIPRIVRIIREQRADATLLAPWWPAQPWFREQLEMSIRPPLRLPNRKHMFLRSTHTPEPLHNCRWKSKIDRFRLGQPPCFSSVFTLGPVHLVPL